jgi:hypothetical protein
MLFTYKDKGPAIVFSYRSNQRPMTKYDSITNIPGKPNPIKQWRKQLQPSGSVQSHATINDLDKSTRSQIDSICKSYNDVYFINECNGSNCTPITRSASTIINKNYSWNNKQYLQRRCKTFDQNQTLGKKLDEFEGYEYYGASCTKDPFGNACKPIVYKPNNKPFKQQGGVSSSSRIAKLKYDTIVNSTNKYNSLSANLDSSSHILNRKPTPCEGWRVTGKRDKNHLFTCKYNNIPFEIINITGTIDPDPAFTNGYYSFTSGTGTITFSKTCTIEILIVAGGGSGGWDTGGGGGGGGYIQKYQQVIHNTPYTISIGTGGKPINTDQNGVNGENGGNSVFDTLIAIGGGGGGSNASGIIGQLSTGGSGGGQGVGTSNSIAITAGLGTSGQGNKGGNATTDRKSGGGGGGGGEIGGDANINGGGKGGNGYASSITGTTVYYAAGGGGGTYFYEFNINGIGGIGGGGNGGSGTDNSTIEQASGKDATGYGCGGGGTGNARNLDTSPIYSGGGSGGIIIIKPIKS